jgi:hypothetical protein
MTKKASKAKRVKLPGHYVGDGWQMGSEILNHQWLVSESQLIEIIRVSEERREALEAAKPWLERLTESVSYELTWHEINSL